MKLGYRTKVNLDCKPEHMYQIIRVSDGEVVFKMATLKLAIEVCSRLRYTTETLVDETGLYA